MTPDQWFASTDPQAMLRFLGGKASSRKLTLYRVGYLRSTWGRLNLFEQSEVEDDERRAERGTRPPTDLEEAAAWFILHEANDALYSHFLSPETKAAQAALLRDLFGPLPFREAHLNPAYLTWNNGTVVKLAEVAYEEREMPSGHLDRGKLAVLADALEECGSVDVELLGHLRGPGPCVRGCWVVDLLLSRT